MWSCTLRSQDTSFSPTSSAVSIVALGALSLAAAAGVVQLRAIKAERDHPPKGRFIECDGVKLHYLESGSGPALVILHGNGAMTADIELSGLIGSADKDFRVIVFDRPGFGYSDRPRNRSWTPAAQAELLAKAFDQLNITSPIVLGHSWGTLVALELALQGCVSGMVLVSGFYFPETSAALSSAAPTAMPFIGDVLNHTVTPFIGGAMAGRLIEGMFAPDPVPERFQHDFPVALTLRPSQIKAFSEETAGMNAAAHALVERYGSIGVPSVVIAGDADTIVPHDHGARLNGKLADSKLIVVPGGSHMLHHRQPDMVVSAVRSVAQKVQA